MSEKKPRKRRIAADEAHAWARDLRLKNPYANSILRALAMYVDSEGVCFVGIDGLAEDTNLSPNTVRSRLKFLEEVGAIARFSQWIDDDGRRNKEGRGRRTTDEIRFLFNADSDEIEAAAGNRGDGGADAASPPIAEASAGEGSARPGDSLSPPLAPQLGGGAESLEPEPEQDSPPAPPPGGSSEGSDYKESISSPEELAEVRANYPIPDNHPARTAALWSALDTEGQAKLRRGALGAKLHRQKTPKAALPALWKFIRDGAYKSYQNTPSESVEVRTVPVESDEGQALLMLYRIAGRPRPFSFTKAGTECWATKQAPLDTRAMACLRAPDIRQWKPVTEAQFAAWREFLVEAIGPQGHPIGEVKTPWPWPPRKDGTPYSATDPPESLMTEQDEAYLVGS